MNGSERDFHLDTGSPRSYISKEYLDSCNVQLPDRAPMNATIRNLSGRRRTQQMVPLTIAVTVRGNFYSAPIQLDAHAVSAWGTNEMLNPPCEDGRCPDSSGTQCGRRLGLVGRNALYALNDGQWLLERTTGRLQPYRPAGKEPQ
jgi:hypothetical protein